jgi:aminoglycoside 3-N-acetyltransferase
LARIYELDGQVLLLGVGHESNTSFHLAEYRAPAAQRSEDGAPIVEDGQRVWKTYNDIELDEEVFGAIGADFEKAVGVRSSGVGSTEAKLFSQRRAVDFAREWLTQRRGELPCPAANFACRGVLRSSPHRSNLADKLADPNCFLAHLI